MHPLPIQGKWHIRYGDIIASFPQLQFQARSPPTPLEGRARATMDKVGSLYDIQQRRTALLRGGGEMMMCRLAGRSSDEALLRQRRAAS